MELETKSNKTGPGRTKRSKVSSDYQNIESDLHVKSVSWRDRDALLIREFINSTTKS